VGGSGEFAYTLAVKEILLWNLLKAFAFRTEKYKVKGKVVPVLN
jgi:hypothetical protein